MTALICQKCLDIPFIQYRPGLTIVFICCDTATAEHMELNKKLIIQYSLKCSKCHIFSKCHYLSGCLLCDNCMKELKTKNINRLNIIKNESLPLICKNHYKKYEYYNKSNYSLYCEYCNIPKASVKLSDIKSVSEIGHFNCNEDSVPEYFKNLFKKIQETFTLFKNSPNSYYNYINFIEFIKEYDVISPTCSKCLKFFQINYAKAPEKEITEETEISSNIINDEYNGNLMFTCKCNQISFDEFTKKINSVKCNDCLNNFEQKNMFYDNIGQIILCEECLYTKNAFDYIRFNEIGYFCPIHKLKNEFYCTGCGNFFCEKCKILAEHTIIKLEEKQLNNKCFETLAQLNWFSKYKKKGFLGLSSKNIKSKNNKNKDNKEITDLIPLFTEKNYSLDIRIYKMKLINYLQTIKNFMLQKDNCTNHININSKIIELERENIKSKLIIETLKKELNQKNELIVLLKERNVYQHLIFNIIKKEYKVFQKIKPDFRILYQSYLYLNYDNDKKNIIKSQIEDIFKQIEELIKKNIKKSVIKKIIQKFKKEIENNNIKLGDIKEDEEEKIVESSDIKNKLENIIEKIKPRVPQNIKVQIINKSFENETKSFIDNVKYSTVKQYHNFLINQNLITRAKKSNEIMKLVEKFEKNDIPEDYYKTGLYKNVNILGDIYIDKLGYLNDKTFNNYIIAELFQNLEQDENIQYLFLEKKYQKKFLKKIGCENDAEFYFYFSLITNVIKRIGHIIHQGDKSFNILFKEISETLNVQKYKLIQTEKGGCFKFIDNTESKNKYIYLSNNNNYHFRDFDEFSKDFIDYNANKIAQYFRTEDINKINNELKIK